MKNNEQKQKTNQNQELKQSEFTSSTQRREGSFASSRTPFIKDLKPFSGEIR